VARVQSPQSSSKTPKARGLPVTRRALEQRLGRLLAAKGKKLRRTRGEIALRDLGAYVVVRDGDSSVVPIKLEELGRSTGVLQAYERLIED
jgi:hypothetical protein